MIVEKEVGRLGQRDGKLQLSRLYLLAQKYLGRNVGPCLILAEVHGVKLLIKPTREAFLLLNNLP